MANTNAPFGFRQYSGTGATPTYEQVPMAISPSYSTAIFFGDPVVQINTGFIQQATSSAATGNVAIAGIFVGCRYLSISQKRVVWSDYWPGSDANNSQNVEAYVCNDPNAQFIVQTANSNTTATAVGVSAIGQNIGFYIGTGNTANGISGAYADQYRLGTDTSLPFRVVNLANSAAGNQSPLSSINGNDNTTAYNYLVVAFNNAGLKSLTGI